MLYISQRAGVQKPVAGRFASSVAISAAITPLILLSPLAFPSAARAAVTTTADDETFETQEAAKNFGDMPLTDTDNLVNHDKTIDLIGDINFGAGSDSLVNTGVITIGAKSTAPVSVTLQSLESLKNSGLIDLRNGHGGDLLTLSGDYSGATNARLGLDIGPDGADKLVVGGVASGKTNILLQGVSAQTATLTGDKGPVLVQGGASSKEDAFSIENAEVGLIRYGLVFDATARTYRLKGVAGQRVYEALKISEGASSTWRRSADAWSAHVTGLRDGDRATVGAGVWGEVHGQWMDRDDKNASDSRRVHVGYRQTTQGGQAGVDLINAALDESRIVIGVTGGYTDAQMRFSGIAAQDVKLSVVNLGGYLAFSRNGYFLNALAKADRQSIKVRGEAAVPDFDGKSFGAQLEVGNRGEEDGLAFEQLIGVSYVSTRLDDMAILSQRLDFDKASGFLAKAGVRGTSQRDVFGGALIVQAAAFVAHDFTVKNELTLISKGEKETLSHDGGHTFGQVIMGISFRSAGGAIVSLDGHGDYGGGREGGGVRLGARFGF